MPERNSLPFVSIPTSTVSTPVVSIPVTSVPRLSSPSGHDYSNVSHIQAKRLSDVIQDIQGGLR